jgi:hypothetical protein
VVVDDGAVEPASAHEAEQEPAIPAAGEPLPWGDDPIAESLDAAEASADAGGEADVPMPWETDRDTEPLAAEDTLAGAAGGDSAAATGEPLMPWEEEALAGSDDGDRGENTPMPWDEPRTGEPTRAADETAAGDEAAHEASAAERILGSDDEQADDDDLDMFRSWLQSLKK